MTDQRRPRVGIIGAGVSGVLAAAHLIETSVDVTVFERLSEPGGVW
jgi:cation diffusion facilitator CzcD-associated flavoprotein CzcO